MSPQTRFARRRWQTALALVVVFASVVAAVPPKVELKRETREALARITADALRAHVSFLASDALEGRRAGARGSDVAAEYIAAQFRRAGLEPAGENGSYFQLATYTSRAAPNTEIKSRNVVGLLRGSDPKLRDTYVVLSAHYDHLGIRENLEGDQIFNGANDDASGTAAVVEVAAALSTLKRRPRRSVLFVAFTGEEHGLRGSRFYAEHPLVPVARTIAQLNLEQIGRTDDTEGARVGAATLTGFDYSDVSEILTAAGARTGVQINKHPTNSDAFFSRSDNRPLADKGIPAHTLSVAYMFPDYHKPGDHWEKIDYPNMEKVVRTIALGVLALADAAREPRWNESNPKTAQYVKAWRELRAGAAR
ncbi:MAG TPA: M28 family peptidase [Pyrinomonadaceae bacterium]|nr:M28 family peptidase [Pyrinomonadaceae bacterium]